MVWYNSYVVWEKGIESPFKGRSHSEATKALIREKATGRVQTEETKQKISNSLYRGGRKLRERMFYKRQWRQTEAGKRETERNRVRRRLKRYYWRIDRVEFANQPRKGQETPEQELARLIREQEKDAGTFQVKRDLPIFDSILYGTKEKY